MLKHADPNTPGTVPPAVAVTENGELLVRLSTGAPALVVKISAGEDLSAAGLMALPLIMPPPRLSIKGVDVIDGSFYR